jgi:hypothetical protein
MTTAWDTDGTIPEPTYLSHAFSMNTEDRHYMISREAKPNLKRATEICKRTGVSKGWLSSWTEDGWDGYLFRSREENALLEEPGTSADDPLYRHMTSVFSYPLTLAYGLSELGVVGSDEEITVALVGARAEAMMPVWLWEEAAKLMQKRLRLEMVGLMTPNMEPVETEHVSISYKEGIYSPRMSSNCLDAVVMFNSGCSDQHWRHVWAPSLAETVDFFKGTPLLFTNYDAIDLASDYGFTMAAWNMVDSRKIRPRVLMEPRQNPFFNLMPGVYPNLRNRVVHTNQYMFAVDGGGE